MYRSAATIAVLAAILVIAVFAALAPPCLMPDCAIYGLMGAGFAPECSVHLMVEVIPVGTLVTFMLLFVVIFFFFSPDMMTFGSGLSFGVCAIHAPYAEPPPLERLSTRLRI